ncbi:hypothetical protein [Vibrio sp. D431a]|uniref:hypothetical protein n=1 Tax=Vibrio sp. D431a TaxID=2837388 RepID=UPI002554DFAA|nr:hypothetical protein [Vibrio sp. D431a]MDK9789921.1 hypothetical protein [Vibrio sp. D431a]
MSNKEVLEENFEEDSGIAAGEIYYYDEQLLLQELPDEKVSPRTVSPFFLPTKRIPKQFIDAVRSYSDDELVSLFKGELPLLSKRVKIYWPVESEKKDNPPYDETQLELYGSVAVSDDRAVLDAITGMAGLLEVGTGVTLLDVTNSLELDVDFDADVLEPNRPLSHDASWHHIEVSKLLSHLGLKNSTPNKKTIRTRLERISKMVFLQRFFKGGTELSNVRQFRIVVDDGIIYLCNQKKLPTRSSRGVNTYTDILIGISSSYRRENEDSGFLSRERLHKVYPTLNKSKIMDFLKWLDSNTRLFFNLKYLTWAIERYFESHPTNSTSQNKSHIQHEMFRNVLLESDLLEAHFNLRLVKRERKDLPPRYKGIDYQIIYNGKVSS